MVEQLTLLSGGKMSSETITIPYKPRPIWKNEIHKGVEAHRFSVIVAHRRFGKTVGSVNHIIKMALMCSLPSPQYAYIAPFRVQAKQIAWAYLKYYTSVIPNRIVNESELYVELPTLHKNRQGARIYVKGADNPDSLRGAYWDGVILDEYAQFRPEVWNEVIRPSLSDRNGWAIFIGTPKGQNAFYEMYQRGVSEPDWYTCKFTVSESKLIPDDEIADMKASMSEDAIRQELYCDFTASAFNVLIPIDLISDGRATVIKPNDMLEAPVVLGVDVARFGSDRSVIVRRQGLSMHKPLVFSGVDNMRLADIIAREINEHKPDAVFIDAGRGEGVIDRLRQLGYRVSEIPFGGKALKDSKYTNRRAEMWDTMAQWLRGGGSLPDDEELCAELAMPEYGYDAKGRILLEAKDKMKERCGRSPDLADAAALTFATPVRKHIGVSATNRKLVANTDYQPF